MFQPMLKWLCSWFVWRFRLARLVVAVVCLSVFVGLNTRRVGPTTSLVGRNTILDLPHCYRGWPLPISKQLANSELQESVRSHHSKGKEVETYDSWQARTEWNQRWNDAGLYEPPMTHKTYLVLRWDSLRWLGSKAGLVVCGIIDVLFALTIIAVILFLQIPRAKDRRPVSAQRDEPPPKKN